jgi:hypothetical protein
MDEERPEDSSPPPDSGRARRAPPTIDLEASEVSGETQGNNAETNAGTSGDASAPPRRSFTRSIPWPSKATMSAMLTAAVTGAVAAALVIAIAWGMGWPGETSAPTTSPQANAGAIDTLASRVDAIEARQVKSSATSPAAAPDPAVAARIDALENSVASLRAELSGARAQSEKLAAELTAVKSSPRDAATPPDIAAINERLSQIERASRAESAELAQQDHRPADDSALRRVVAASMLDVSVRQGEPFAAQLAAAKALAPNPDALKPLDGFAVSGVPSAASLSRELLALAPKLSPPAPENATTGTGIVDRLQAGAAKLVRIERTDAVGNDRGAIIARVTAAALRDDYAGARRELNTLAPGDRAAAQAWLERANERDAALAASRHFATEAVAALAEPAQ